MNIDIGNKAPQFDFKEWIIRTFFAVRLFHHNFIKSKGPHPFLGLSSAKLESASSTPLSNASVEMRAIIRHLARILFERFVRRLS